MYSTLIDTDMPRVCLSRYQ